MLGFTYLTYLSQNGYLKSGEARILDIGSQNLLNCSVDDLVDFVKTYRKAGLDEGTLQEIKRIHYFTTPRAGERTAFVAELLALTDIDYQGVDICPAPATRILNLNVEGVPDDFRGAFDVVLNFGTLEHIIGQANAMMFIHDALRVGGICFHQLPSVGWLNHGYYVYHPQFFRDVAEANDYTIEDMWYNPSGGGPCVDASIPHRSELDSTKDENVDKSEETADYFNLCAITRRTSQEPFILPLETKTSHSSLDRKIKHDYVNIADDILNNLASLRKNGIDSDEKLRGVLYLIQAVPRTEKDRLQPIIEEWVSEFALPYLPYRKKNAFLRRILGIVRAN